MTDQLFERFADKIGGKAGGRSAFGEPVIRGELSIVPVARVRWGFGAGSGAPMDPDQPAMVTGAGAGGAVMVDPIGYLEIGPGGTQFKPIAAAYPSALFVLAGGITATLVLRAVARLVRR